MNERTYNLDPSLIPLAQGPWLASPDAVEQGLAMFQRIDLTAHMAAWEQSQANRDRSEAPKPYAIQDGIAVIPVDGVMMRKRTSMSSLFGGCVSTIELSRVLALAERDWEVRKVLLNIHSPGGDAAGVSALGDRIAAFSKPIGAYAGDLCCSGAYWIASQCDWISCGATANVGSIGAYTVIRDTSKMYADQGVRVVVVSDGEFKGVGIPGTKITEEQLADTRERITDLGDEFRTAVARGRHMKREAVDAVAGGRVFNGRKAKANRLVDHVESFEGAFQRLLSYQPTAGPYRTASHTGDDPMARMSFVEGVRAWLSGDKKPEDLTVSDGADEQVEAPATAAATETATEVAETTETATEAATETVQVSAADLADLKAKAERAEKLADQIEKDRAESVRADNVRWVEAQTKAGRLTPAMRDQAMSVLATDGAKAFKACIEQSPAKVDLAERGFDMTESAPISIHSHAEWLAADSDAKTAAVKEFMAAYDVPSFAEAAERLEKQLKAGKSA